MYINICSSNRDIEINKNPFDINVGFGNKCNNNNSIKIPYEVNNFNKIKLLYVILPNYLLLIKNKNNYEIIEDIKTYNLSYNPYLILNFKNFNINNYSNNSFITSNEKVDQGFYIYPYEKNTYNTIWKPLNNKFNYINYEKLSDININLSDYKNKKINLYELKNDKIEIFNNYKDIINNDDINKFTQMTCFFKVY